MEGSHGLSMKAPKMIVAVLLAGFEGQHLLEKKKVKGKEFCISHS